MRHLAPLAALALIVTSWSPTRSWADSAGEQDSAITAGSPVPLQRQEASLPTEREETAAAALNGYLYVIGGFDANGQDTNTVFVFDGRRWTDGPRMPVAVNHPAAAVTASHLYVAGGFGAAGASDRVFMLASSRHSWIETARLRHARGALALVGMGQQLYALGGKDAGGVEIPAGEVYSLASKRWSEIGALPYPRDHVAGFAYQGWACVAGGRAPNTTRVDCYDPGRKRWRRLPDLPVPTSGAGAALLGHDVFVGGGQPAGEGGQVIGQLAVLHGGKWRLYGMLIPRHGFEFAVFKGRIWACGGGIAPGLHPTSACTSIRASS